MKASTRSTRIHSAQLLSQTAIESVRGKAINQTAASTSNGKSRRRLHKLSIVPGELAASTQKAAKPHTTSANPIQAPGRARRRLPATRCSTWVLTEDPLEHRRTQSLLVSVTEPPRGRIGFRPDRRRTKYAATRRTWTKRLPRPGLRPARSHLRCVSGIRRRAARGHRRPRTPCRLHRQSRRRAGARPVGAAVADFQAHTDFTLRRPPADLVLGGGGRPHRRRWYQGRCGLTLKRPITGIPCPNALASSCPFTSQPQPELSPQSRQV